MKTILIPTDFSKTANNAADYAIEIAKLSKATVILLNVYHIPLVASDIPVIIPSLDELENNSMKRLATYEKDLHAKHGKQVVIEKIVKPGFVIDEIRDIVKEKKVDLIVMGITGEGRITEIIGSNATGVIKNIDCPTLIIPQNAKYKKIQNIAFACDYESVTNSPAIKKFKTFLQLFNAKLMIFNIVDPKAEPEYAHAVSGVKIENIFENFDHSLYFPESEDLVLGINEFVDEHNVDMLVMIPKKHNLFAHMFQRTNIKKMAFHTHVPLLSIHE